MVDATLKGLSARQLRSAPLVDAMAQSALNTTHHPSNMSYSASGDLGSVDAVTALFSYPNNPGSFDTLFQVAEHWITLSLTRDGMAPAVSCSMTTFISTTEAPPTGSRLAAHHS